MKQQNIEVTMDFSTYLARKEQIDRALLETWAAIHGAAEETPAPNVAMSNPQKKFVRISISREE